MLASMACQHPKPDASKYWDISEQKYQNHQWTGLVEKGKIGMYFKRHSKIYCGEVMYNEYPMKNIDTASFLVMGESGYAKDKQHVYYPLQQTCVDGENWGCCYCSDYMTGADVSTFQFKGGTYGVDRYHVYFMGKVIKNTNPESFLIINACGDVFFGKDSHTVYNGREILIGADAPSFHYDSLNEENYPSAGIYIFSDKKNSWAYRNGLLTVMRTGKTFQGPQSILKIYK